MIIVTGGAGFIGSNLIKYLNGQGRYDIIVIDDLTDGHKFENLKGLDFMDYVDKDTLGGLSIKNDNVDKVYHCGAISSTTEWNGKKMMMDNYEFTCSLFHKCYSEHIPFVHLSSASVYGNSKTFREEDRGDPLNVYAFSKYRTDLYIMQTLINMGWRDTWVFRPFNVYGEREQFKYDQASPVTKFRKQFEENGYVEVFAGSQDIYRDFICVDDVVKIMVDYTCDNPGLYNLGTGKPESFYNIAVEIAGDDNVIEKVFPSHLKDKYQYYSKADTSLLRTNLVGDYSFVSVTDYVRRQNEIITQNST